MFYGKFSGDRVVVLYARAEIKTQNYKLHCTTFVASGRAITRSLVQCHFKTDVRSLRHQGASYPTTTVLNSFGASIHFFTLNLHQRFHFTNSLYSTHSYAIQHGGMLRSKVNNCLVQYLIHKKS